MTQPKTPNLILDLITNSLTYYKNLGYQGFDCSPETLKTLDKWAKTTHHLPQNLFKVRLELGKCKRCDLSKSRKNIVFGSGNEKARLMFVGEIPGQEEDLKGEPFVGAAGQLLTKIISAIGLTRSDVYICNLIKCRPPENRNPSETEISTCLQYLEQQIQIIAPEYICTLGPLPAQALLRSSEPLSILRGRFFPYNQCQIVPTYHPADLLQNPAQKRDVWEDMKMIANAMGIKL